MLFVQLITRVEQKTMAPLILRAEISALDFPSVANLQLSFEKK